MNENSAVVRSRAAYDGLIVLRKRDTWFVAIGIFLALLFWDIARTYPPLRTELAALIAFPPGIAQRSEPIIATGTVGKGDFLAITYTEVGTATFIYESSGQSATSLAVRYEPGTRAVLQLEMPSVMTAGEGGERRTGPLRLRLNGTDILRHPVPFNPCKTNEIFLGENPVGGSTLGTQFRGQILTDSEAELRGRPDALIPFKARLWEWLTTRLWHFLPLLIVAVGATVLGRILIERDVRLHAPDSGWLQGALKLHGVFVAMAALNLVLFAWLMTGGKFRLIYPDAFGAFYDFQAQSLLHGRIDVPDGTLGGEAFVVAGKEYGYFGPTPALLRVPLVIAGIGFGHLTRSFMLADYLACLVAAYMLLRHSSRLVSGAKSRPSNWAVLIMMIAAGAGSSLLFLASRVYVYHEAILCGVAFTLWSGYFSLRYLESPRPRWWIAALIGGVLAVQARPPVGLFALCLLGCVAAAHTIANRKSPAEFRRAMAVGASAVLGLLTLQMVAYWKFGTPNGAPLHLNVQYTPERLAKIEGKIFHVANIRNNLDAYFLRPAFQASIRFPFLTFDLKPRRSPSAKMDLEEHVVGILYSMAGLVALCVISAVGTYKRSELRRPLLVVALASLPLAACMLMFIATSHRYTADFCPPLFIGAAFGLAYCDTQKRLPRILLLVAAMALSVSAFALTLGVALHFQADLVWGVPEEVRLNFYQLRDRFDCWFGVT